MKRMVLTIFLDELSELKNSPMLTKLKSFEVLEFLSQPPGPISMICSLELTDPTSDVKDVLGHDCDRVEVLERGERGQICFLRVRRFSEGFGLIRNTGYYVGFQIRKKGSN